MVKRIVLLFSDAGAGHRSAAQAIAEALHDQYGDRVETPLVDGLKRYARWPVSHLPGWYPRMVARGGPTYGLLYGLLDGRPQIRMLGGALWPLMRANTARFLRDYPADLYLSVHPAFCQMLRGMGPGRPPFITVATDLMDVHSLWFWPRSDLFLAPTEAVRDQALRHGYAPDQVRVTGLPVARRFSAPGDDRAALKARLGWPADRPAVLVVGGGEGMGPVFAVARAIDRAGLPCALAVVAGRNDALRARLEAAHWRTPAHIYGFVREMPDLMRAADVLVSKAGALTICEALITGLPIILYGRVAGQESGNVRYVVGGGAALWAPGPRRVVAALRSWIGPGADTSARQRAAENARRLARPDAARRIAEIAWELAGAARIGGGS